MLQRAIDTTVLAIFSTCYSIAVFFLKLSRPPK